MYIQVDISGVQRVLEAQAGQSVLDVLQANNIEISAACGGIGKCGKCQVLVNDGSGLKHRLACEVPVCSGMEVVVERAAAIEAVESGIAEAFPPDPDAHGYGIAFDVGTTTLAAHLHDLKTGARLASASRANPQSAFGADVISRISASVEGKLDLMTSVMQDALALMAQDLCERAGVDCGGICKATLAGNTVMEHIACGLAPDSIGVSPFTPLSLFGDTRPLQGLPETYFARCIAGYVGGDITAGMLARGIDSGACNLFLDLGTNGEMALCHNGVIYCCATAAGPVFEGANIFFGMPALPGAISKVSLVEGRIQISVLGDGDPIGICGTGIVDAVATMLEMGLIEESGRMKGPHEVDASYAEYVGEENGSPVFYLCPSKQLYLTQKDIRCVQLAKAAVCGGIRTLLLQAGIETSEVDRIDVAGGFGAFINMHSAARIGLFPPELENRATSVGNSSAEGAAALLLSREARQRESAIVEACTYIELSTSKEFNDFYIDMMEFE